MYQSQGCESFFLQPVAEKIRKGKGGEKFIPGHGPAVPKHCPETGSGFLMGGPIWYSLKLAKPPTNLHPLPIALPAKSYVYVVVGLARAEYLPPSPIQHPGRLVLPQVGSDPRRGVDRGPDGPHQEQQGPLPLLRPGTSVTAFAGGVALGHLWAHRRIREPITVLKRNVFTAPCCAFPAHSTIGLSFLSELPSRVDDFLGSLQGIP